jgi:hypothetical protein
MHTHTQTLSLSLHLSFSPQAVHIIANDLGDVTTPSYVAFTEGERLVGAAAKLQAASNPTNTVYDVKRIMGRDWNDPSLESDMTTWPFKVRPWRRAHLARTRPHSVPPSPVRAIPRRQAVCAGAQSWRDQGLLA